MLAVLRLSDPWWQSRIFLKKNVYVFCRRFCKGLVSSAFYYSMRKPFNLRNFLIFNINFYKRHLGNGTFVCDTSFSL